MTVRGGRPTGLEELQANTIYSVGL